MRVLCWKRYVHYSNVLDVYIGWMSKIIESHHLKWLSALYCSKHRSIWAHFGWSCYSSLQVRGVNVEVCAPAVPRRWVDTKVCAEEAWTRKYAVLRREEATDLKNPLTSLPPFENEQPKIHKSQIGIRNIPHNNYEF